jgi:hypothetical protein
MVNESLEEERRTYSAGFNKSTHPRKFTIEQSISTSNMNALCITPIGRKDEPSYLKNERCSIKKIGIRTSHVLSCQIDCSNPRPSGGSQYGDH